MAGPFLGINMASQTLRSMQRALDTTGHNIANVNTVGYSRQTVDFATLTPLDFYNRGWHAVGQGVGITGINRIRDQYLDASARNASSNLNKYSTLATGLGRIDQVYGEPSELGIANALDGFFDAWSSLASNPSDVASRSAVRNAGQVLADRVRSTYAQMSNERTRTQTEITSTFTQIDALTNEIAQLNSDIKRYSVSGHQANDLMDRRDLAVQKLSGLVNVSVERFEDGSYAVYAAGATVVDSAGSRSFAKTYDAATSTVSDGTLTYRVTGGALAGHLSALNSMNNQMTGLDRLANNLRTEINALHTTGTNALGQTGIYFFNGEDTMPQTGAIDFNLSVEVATSAEAIAAGVTVNPGDAGLALTLSKLRDVSIAGLSNQTFQGFFRGQVNVVANEAAYYDMATQTERSIATQIEQQQQGVMGVNIDDEMANMMRFQRSYQAAAKAMTIFDQVAEDLLAMVRR